MIALSGMQLEMLGIPLARCGFCQKHPNITSCPLNCHRMVFMHVLIWSQRPTQKPEKETNWGRSSPWGTKHETLTMSGSPAALLETSTPCPSQTNRSRAAWTVSNPASSTLSLQPHIIPNLQTLALICEQNSCLTK